MSASVTDIRPDPVGVLVPTVVGGVLAVVGEHDISTVDALTRDLSLLTERGGRCPVVDLSRVTFMDASIVSLLIRTNRDLLSESRVLVVRAPSPSARRLLELCEQISPLGLCIEPCGQCADSGAA